MIVGLFFVSQFKYMTWFHQNKETEIKTWFIISLLTTTIGAYVIVMFIVNSRDFQGNIVHFPFTTPMTIVLTVYLIITLISVLFEVLHLNKLQDELMYIQKNKYFMGFTATRFISIVLIMSFIVMVSL